jgi:hypothetical protein
MKSDNLITFPLSFSKKEINYDYIESTKKCELVMLKFSAQAMEPTDTLRVWDQSAVQEFVQLLAFQMSVPDRPGLSLTFFHYVIGSAALAVIYLLKN